MTAGAGRPLRFLAAIAAIWIGVRAVSIGSAAHDAPVIAMPDPSMEAAMRGYRGFRERFPMTPPLIDFPISDRSWSPALPSAWAPVVPAEGRGAPPSRRPAPRFGTVAATRPTTSHQSVAIGAMPARDRAPIAAVSLPRDVDPPGRWGASGWAIVRGGGGARDFAGGRLGAAQAGVRLTYALDAGRRLALAGRVSTPLRGRGREAALGLDWRPTRLPVHLLAEQRFALDRGASSGPAVSLIGGVDALSVAAGFRLEGYGQAGIARIGGFADGGVRLARPVARIGGLRLDLGIGAWGGAQPGAMRVDLGPGATLRVPVAGRSLRLALDWRQRVAGRAAPGSGPALSIGSDL